MNLKGCCLFYFFILFQVTFASYDGVNNPKVTIITSLYNSDIFIADFLADIVQQTIFDQCELLVINANSPGNEDPIIYSYCDRYPNIKYVKLNYDPGLYGVWNMGIKMARAEYITNANVDDRLAYECYQTYVIELDNNQDIDLVYSDHYNTYEPNVSFIEAEQRKMSFWRYPKFKPEEIQYYCLPNCHPMWRKSIHQKIGFFEEKYKSAGDWDMWIKAVKGGFKFKRIEQLLGTFYLNQDGLSHSEIHKDEVLEIRKKYNFYVPTSLEQDWPGKPQREIKRKSKKKRRMRCRLRRSG